MKKPKKKNIGDDMGDALLDLGTHLTEFILKGLWVVLKWILLSLFNFGKDKLSRIERNGKKKKNGGVFWNGAWNFFVDLETIIHQRLK